MNSWSMLYDVMNDLDWVSANGGFEYTPTGSQPEQQSTFNVDMSHDKIELPDNTNGFWKYERKRLTRRCNASELWRKNELEL